jgi:TetR/AcrR family transcriptional regulator
LLRATAEFARKGFDGARVDEIAARCKISKYALYYYFGSKEGLFTAVLDHVYQTLRARQHEISVRHLEPIDALRELVSHVFAAFRENPEAIAIVNSENLHKGRHIRRLTGIRQLYDPMVDTIRELLERGAAQGLFRPNLDPVLLYIALSSLCYLYVSNQFTLGAIFGRDLMSKTSQKVWVAHITEMVVAYCREGDARLTASLARRARA